MKLVHWPFMGGLLHLVHEEGTGRGRSPSYKSDLDRLICRIYFQNTTSNVPVWGLTLMLRLWRNGTGEWGGMTGVSKVMRFFHHRTQITTFRTRSFMHKLAYQIISQHV